uniref:Uncharacterized protein n=1 Tax=Octactis speculum TaxID=3111310 RepID=A0A7S2G7L9_9STRA|mmetsp:Transcript_40844/g.55616  ORF Transcript_40844/g.55616 Transcript_40844/m.55616 type:complete len:177 (+) Transcript_40844:34-564(+)|eukprot:CAMPEP_0185781542 /NCGR_PEP_ID=MMETSP1174-20130828/102820_1 /TAXON_ID=35687 /ORGANISM="Dictyocha speculum, Strain CCMP1381" /LENGTH=176 /DNA_ID=CAMNT_0028471563 /DNA_START=8 /DNA_END=538 /DNA_ORIENTATION=-
MKVSIALVSIWLGCLLQCTCYVIPSTSRLQHRRNIRSNGRVVGRRRNIWLAVDSEADSSVSAPEGEEFKYDEKWMAFPETAEEAWANPYLQDKAREVLLQQYLDLGKDKEYAAAEVESYLSDEERSKAYMMKLALTEQPGSLAKDPNQLYQYAGVFVLGFVGSAVLRYLGNNPIQF